MSIDMSQFYQVFFEESAEHLAAMESLLLDLDIENPDAEQLNAIFRAAHSIKGSAGTFGFTDLSGLTHILENLLDSIRKHELVLRADMVDAFLEAGDLLREMLAAHQGQGEVDPAEVETMSQRLRQLTQDGGSVVLAQPTAPVPVTTIEAPETAAPAESTPAQELEATPASNAGRRTFDIEFVPTANAVTGDGLRHFLEDLAGLGMLDITSKPSDGADQVGFWHLRLTTDSGPEGFSEQLDFIAENDAWRVSEDKSADADGKQAFGLFADAPGVSDEARGYGFFEPLSDALGQFLAEISGEFEDAGGAYGLFGSAKQEAVDSVPDASTPVLTGAPDDSYGFFEPLPAASDTAPASPPEVAPVVALEGDGFGFFEPLPVPAEAGPSPVTPEIAPVPAVQDDCLEGGGYGLFLPLAPGVAAQVAASEGKVAAASSTAPSVETEAAPVPVPVPASPIVSKPAEDVEATSTTTAPVASRRAAKPAAAPAAAADTSIRVSVEKVDQLINLVGELVITQAMLLQTCVQMQESAPESLVNGLAQLERNTRDLQETVMSIRMMPISFVFSRFPRVVRDVSGKLGKQVELKTSGETTELDKGLIEKITDPLTHLIRNSLDHGIESPEKRVAAGKSPVGTITLKAYHQGGNIVIEVGDDGAGLNRQRILAKARERGMQVSDQMTDQEVFALIFEAGFSTAEQITDVSGRGVGMDVVRKNIQALGGRIEIESMAGIGTRMTVRLPLTLAILDGMSIAVGNQKYILPLSYVVESLQVSTQDIKTLSNQGRVIQVRGEYLPVVVLHEVFGLPGTYTDFTQGIMVVLDADGAKAALFVDALLGQHQVVIKSLEANYRRVPGVSGATIMGDGHVALILDVSAVANLARSAMTRAA
jgi:two-component system chemotaxis sensor kinase CheA